MDNHVQLDANVYRNLITTLKECELDDLIKSLQGCVIGTIGSLNGTNKEAERPDSPVSDNSDCVTLCSSDDDSSREDNFHTKLQVVKEPLSINVKKATKFRDRPEFKHIGTYPMRSNPRGLVLIIANNLYKIQKDRRPSAKHDEANLKKLFVDMGFRVITYFDLTGEEIEEKVQEFSQMAELRRVDSAFVIVSSHGSGKLGHQETEILGVDYNTIGYKKVVCTNIINFFTAEKCRNLSGKPKIFIFQTCRGENEQVAVPRYKIDAATTSRPVIEEPYIHFSDTMRNYEDMLIVYATIPGYVSYRDEFNGSWFIQVLCEVFMNYAHKVPVQELFYMIDSRLKNIRTLSDACQTPSITSQGFNQYCFLNPGLFEDKSSIQNGATNGNEHESRFKCCPDRKAKILVCTYCESVYHQQCASKLGTIKTLGSIKADCCSNKIIEKDEEDNKSLSENVGELKKVLFELKKENHHLKNQISSLQTQHVDIISSEIDLKNSKQTLEVENLVRENDLLKELNTSLKQSNVLLTEKHDRLFNKMMKKKKNQWVKKSVCKVLRKKKKKKSNIVEPVED
ncbi:hypothetical protein QAD02_011895 [Eretmocerus hayati]|uniref:Uncharacterized protein n=1 Tax=Eretmocerus hayati TaxID=131215 RepID=A0ACC2NYF6_9HYME|nr:hypothetical protein QAD02_011895 [Eretmocerus hayati]